MGAGAGAVAFISEFGPDAIVCVQSTWTCDEAFVSATPISILSTEPIRMGDTTITLGGMSVEKRLRTSKFNKMNPRYY